MNPLTTILVGSFIIGFSGAMMPGPLLTVCIAETARRGFLASVLICVGHSILEFGIVVAFIFGLQHLISANYVISLLVSVLGGAFLLWMAYGMITGVVTKELTLDLEAKEESRARLSPVSAGILISISNPYWFLWWVFVGSALVLESRNLGIAGMTAFYMGHIASDFTWYMFIGALVALGVSVGKQLRYINTIYRGIILACALFLVLLGGKFVNTGIEIARTRRVPEMKPRQRLLENTKKPEICDYCSIKQFHYWIRSG